MNEMIITVSISCPELTNAINTLAGAIGGAKAQEGNSANAVPTGTVPNTPVAAPAVNMPASAFPQQTAPVVPTAPVSAASLAPTAVPTAPVSVAPVAPYQPPAPVQGTAPVTAVPVTAPTTVPAYTIEQFQVAIAPLLDAGKVQQIQQLVQSFGVATLMDIPKERYGEFANGLRSLGGVL